MCALNAALDFGKNMIALGASTLGRLVAIQFADLTASFERQSVAMRRLTEARDITALTVLEREFREGFWHDRRAALAATGEALQIASRVAADGWAEMVKQRQSPPALSAAKPVTRPAARKAKPKATDNPKAKGAKSVVKKRKPRVSE